MLAVARGTSCRDAAAGAGRRSAQAVARLVVRFNRDCLAALEPHGRRRSQAALRRLGTPADFGRSTAQVRSRADGTASWSLMTLRRALRRAPDGLPAVITYTIGQVLHGSGYR